MQMSHNDCCNSDHALTPGKAPVVRQQVSRAASSSVKHTPSGSSPDEALQSLHANAQPTTRDQLTTASVP